MLYRSRLTRWVISGAGIFAGVMLAFGSGRWRSTPSLMWLAQAGIPLRAWGIAVAAYAVLLLFKHTRPAGYAAGAVLFTVFAISLAATLADGGPANAVVLAALLDVIAFHAFSVRTSWAIKLADEPPDLP